MTSRGTSTFASDCFTPLPTCQIMASGICFLNGHEPEHISYQTVLKKNQQQTVSVQNLFCMTFPCLALPTLRTCFPALSTRQTFSRAFHSSNIFPALAIGYMFMLFISLIYSYAVQFVTTGSVIYCSFSFTTVDNKCIFHFQLSLKPKGKRSSFAEVFYIPAAVTRDFDLPEGVHIGCKGELRRIRSILLRCQRAKNFRSQIRQPSFWDHQHPWSDRPGGQASYTEQAEISDHHAVIQLQKYILRAQISVYDASSVKISHPLRIHMNTPYRRENQHGIYSIISCKLLLDILFFLREDMKAQLESSPICDFISSVGNALQ